MDNERRIRIQFDMSESSAKELDELIAETNLGTRTAYLNNALSLFKWAIKHSRGGAIIAAMNNESDSYVELATPALDEVSPKGKVTA